MPVDIKFIEDDIDDIKLDDVSNLDVQGDLYIKYADSNSPASFDETYDEPITDEVIHAYIGFNIGLQEPISVDSYYWCVRDLTAIEEALNNLLINKQDKLTEIEMNAVDSGITEQLVTSYNSHLENQNNPHNVTKEQIGLSNVDNKSEAELKQDIMTNQNVVEALGYTPGTSDFSGDYNDLTNKPTIPVVPENITQSVSVNGSTYTPDANGNVDLGNIGGGGSSYTAGVGIDITNNVISVKPATLQLIGYEEDE